MKNHFQDKIKHEVEDRYNDLKHHYNHDNSWNFPIGLLLGAAVGAVIALLYAPKKGQELRGDINQQFGEAKDKASTWVNETIDSGKEKINQEKNSY